jgi:biotin carboxyl carrier protein
MKLQAEIEGQKHDIEIVRDGRNVHARVGEREYDLDISEPETGVFLIKNSGRVFEVSIDPKTAEGSNRVSLKDRVFNVKITDPKRLRGSAGGSADAAGKAEIKTAMPGKVVRILKQTGDAVEHGEGVIVVEAMKMQNEMKSPKDGTITAIKFVEGDTVAAGDVLVTIE